MSDEAAVKKDYISDLRLAAVSFMELKTFLKSNLESSAKLVDNLNTKVREEKNKSNSTAGARTFDS
eukprot:992980-Prymnesium_polylepis.1